MKIAFFGDSISESGRNLLDENDLGTGYVKIAAGKLHLLYPEKELHILNRGVGGNKTADLLARVDDVIKEKPDIVFLQVGVNDVWCRFSHGEAVSPAQFRANYTALVEKLTAAGARVYCILPFVLNMGDKQRFRPYLDEFNRGIREIAAEYKLPVIPLDEIFTGVTQDIDPAQFTTDGVHPTHRGCRYIADLVIKELKKIL